MPKTPPIPHLSIIVPIGRDLDAFERTLISVLEHQPLGCEVLVAHDGSYDDPFDLCDEVRFVVAGSRRLIDLVAAGAAQARGRFVHVIADGVRATSGWTDEALEKFEHFDAGSVAPVIRDAATHRIIAAGWQDGSDRLCKNACQGRDQIESESTRMIGAYLQASFWRCQLLRSLSEAFRGGQGVEAAYAYEHLIREAGWRCVLASDCNLMCDAATLPWDSTSVTRGKRLRAIRNHFRHGGWSRSVSAACHAVLANAIRPRYIAEAMGQAAAPLATRSVANKMRPGEVLPCSDVVALSQPGRSLVRRAA